MNRSVSAQNPIAITGGGGFVGKYVQAALLETGVASEAIDVLGLPHDSHSLTRSNFYGIDITEFDSVKRYLLERTPSAVIHLAAVASPASARADQALAWKVNFDATRNLGELMRTLLPQSRLVFASTSEVYGRAFNDYSDPIREDAAVKPNTVYAATKAAAEIALTQMISEGLDVIIFRPFNHTGPNQSPEYVAPSFVSQLREVRDAKAPPVIHVGNLNAERDFLDVRDIARAYVAGANATDVPSDARIMNLASGRPISISTLLDTLIELSGLNVEVLQDPERMRPSEVPRASGNVDRSRMYLGWRPEINISQTLEEMLNAGT